MVASTPVLATPSVIGSDIWFQDGNIVLVAGGVAFKVHRGQLSRHSEVFSGLFSVPQPDDQERFDGCACLELHDDPSDVYFFLSALYDGLYFKSPRADNFPSVASVLRLSTKYMVEHLRERCLRRLEIDWPNTLAGWDRREQEATTAVGRYVPRENFPHPIHVIELALELGLTTILPSALYDLSRYGPSRIVSGTPAPPLPFEREPHPEPISPSHEMLLRILRGREVGQRYLAAFIVKELEGRKSAPTCAYKGTEAARYCVDSFYFITLNILRAVGGIACGRDGDPLFTLVQATDMMSRTDFSDGQQCCGLKLCQPCKVDFATAAARAREEVWCQLPRWFETNMPGPWGMPTKA